MIQDLSRFKKIMDAAEKVSGTAFNAYKAAGCFDEEKALTYLNQLSLQIRDLESAFYYAYPSNASPEKLHYNFIPGKILKIEIPWLPPSRYYKDGYVISLYSRLVKDSFEMTFGESEQERFSQKVRIGFLFIYHDSSAMRDADNIEIKQLIDEISMYFMRDDSPQYMSLSIDSVVGDEDKTLITVSPDE